MARDETAPRADKRQSLLNRRSYLKLAGATAAAVAGLGSSGAAAQADTGYLLHDSFENTDYRGRFSSSWRLGNYDEPTTSEMRSGDRSLHVPLPAGSHYGMDATLDLADAGYTDDPPRELYASYWVKFGAGFEVPHNFAGKLPGFQNHERRPSGSAGTPSDGTNGWAARGMFTNGGSDVGLGYYCYHMDMSGSYGDRLDATTVTDGEWHHIEQRLKLNTVSGGSANRDGVLTMWLDGDRAYHDDSMAFTLSPERGINYAFQVYYGGSEPSPADNDIYIDDWVLSTERVGHPGPRHGSDDSTVFLLEAGEEANAAEYEFTVEGSVQKRYAPAGEKAESYNANNDGITINDDGTTTVTGISSAGHADSFFVNGEVIDITLNADLWTLYWANEEVTPSELTGGNGSGRGSENGSVAIDRFEISKSELLGDDRMFSVQWAVSGSEEELDTVEVVAAEDVSDLNFAVTDVSGGNASGWDLFQFPIDTELEVSLRVQDAAENAVTETKSITL